MKLTVEEIYDRLVNDDKILTKKGRITFTLGDIDIIVRQRDVVGNIMQEWVEGWLKKNDIEYALNDNTQMCTRCRSVAVARIHCRVAREAGTHPAQPLLPLSREQHPSGRTRPDD